MPGLLKPSPLLALRWGRTCCPPAPPEQKWEGEGGGRTQMYAQESGRGHGARDLMHL